MKYMILIYTEERDMTKLSPGDLQAMMKPYVDYNTALERAGALVGGEPLAPVSTATTLRVRNGKTLRTDGPFMETKEVLGGYYLIEARDLDEALAWGARCPGAHHGAVEVRPLAVLPER